MFKPDINGYISIGNALANLTMHNFSSPDLLVSYCSLTVNHCQRFLEIEISGLLEKPTPDLGKRLAALLEPYIYPTNPCNQKPKYTEKINEAGCVRYSFAIPDGFRYNWMDGTLVNNAYFLRKFLSILESQEPKFN